MKNKKKENNDPDNKKSSRKVISDLLENKIPYRVPYLEMLISKNVLNSLHPGIDYFEFCVKEGLDLLFVKRDFNNHWLNKDKGTYINEWGIIRKKGYEEVDDYIEGPVRTRSDLKKLKIPDPLKDSGFKTLKEVVKKYKNKKIICYHTKATFSHVWYLMGNLQEYLISIYTEPELIKSLNKITEEYHLAEVNKAIELGADIVVLSDDYAYKDRMFIPRKIFITFCLPAINNISELVHKKNKHLFFHSDGNILEVMDLIIDTGIDFLHPVEPEAMNILSVYKKYKDEVIICGNVDCAWTLTFSSLSEVRKEVIWLLENIAPEGRFILSSSNTIHSKVKPENYRTMIDTIHKYETYPINIDQVVSK